MKEAPTTTRPLLLTGAAGKLGSLLRPHLAGRIGGIRSTDLRSFGPALAKEEIVLADLADAVALDPVVSGTSAIVHLGAVTGEDSFDRVLQANIVGTKNLFEAARRHGVKRVVYASSIHVVGYYPANEQIDTDAPPRPDSFYAVSKAFGENLARLYVDKAGLEVACLRIGIVLPEPTSARHLWTWLSVADLTRLVDTCLETPDIGHAVIYGISNNRRFWWRNEKSRIPYRPQDDAESYAGDLRQAGMLNEDDPVLRHHGGGFVALQLGQRPA